MSSDQPRDRAARTGRPVQAASLPDAAARVLTFWFEELQPEQWFEADPVLDAACSDRFADLTRALLESGAPAEWTATAKGTLAAVLVLDQFTRNIYRDSADAFAGDAAALALSQSAVGSGLDSGLDANERKFLYMPYMHSESAAVQAAGIPLFESLGDEQTAGFAMAHKEVIDRFGRFPHRNAVLGRASTPEEEAFMREHGQGF